MTETPLCKRKSTFQCKDTIKVKLFCQHLPKIQIMFSDKLDFPKQPET